MPEELPATVGIKRRPNVEHARAHRVRRRRWRVWLLGLGIFLLALLAIAGAAVLGGAWYIEGKALDKLTEIGARAGLDVQAAGVVIEPGSRLEIFGLVVADPSDGAVLLRADRVVTDLTFDDLRAGRRRPTDVVIVGLQADFSQPERWKKAAEHYRSRKREGPRSGAKRELPRIRFSGATVHVPDYLNDPSGLATMILKDVAARFEPTLGGSGRFYAGASATLPEGRRSELTLYLDPKGDNHEAGITFEPELTVRIPGGPPVSIAAAYVKGRELIRFRDVNVVVSPSRFLSAKHIEIGVKPGDLLPGAPMTVTLRQLETGFDGSSLAANALTVEFDGETGAADDAGGLASLRTAVDPKQVLARVRRVVLTHSEVDARPLSLDMQAVEIAIDLAGIDTKKPLASVAQVALSAADIDWVLPGAKQAAGIPYYRQVQSFLMGKDAPPILDEEAPDPRGGGPMSPVVPGSGSTTRPSLTAVLGDSRPTLTLADGTLALRAQGSSEAAFLVQGLSASILPGAEGKAVTASVKGRLQELATGESGSFLLEATTGSDGGLQKARVKLAGSKLAHQVARFSDNIRLSAESSLSVDLTVTPHAEGRGLTATGTLGLANMGFEARRIHGTPVDGLEVEAEVTLDFDPEANRFTLDAPRIQIANKAHIRLAATVENLDADMPKLDVRLRLPSQPCDDVISAIPPVMIRRLEGMRLRGNMAAHLDFSVDLLKPRTYKHDLDVDLRHCKVVEFGNADVRRLNRRFVHRVIEKGEDIGVLVGPGTGHFRPLNRIPKHVQMGALHTEDHSFFRHSGFRPPLMRRAVIMNLEGGRYVYGGSTITQQLVKNLFLSREKTLTRKLEEAIIVWLLERHLTKQRILELYLNCIEYGPKIYGIQNAAKAYFGKNVEELEPIEGAFLMGLKPYPWSGWNQFERGWMKSWWHRRVKKIMIGMEKSGWITAEELEMGRAYGWEPIFLTSKNRRRPELPPVEPEPTDEEPAAGQDGQAPPPTPNEMPILIE
ncbi:MAG: hypothetical protein ACI9OJ_001924 [Myxococcota bacterium]|jgi:hypothetical protein